MTPPSMSARISGDCRREDMMIGGDVIPRAFWMNGVLVPLPEPGAPMSQMISAGKLPALSPTG